MHHTGKKKRVKKKIKGPEKFALRGFEPGPYEYVRTKNETPHLGKRT